MAGVNKVILVGNLGRDPEIKYSQDGMSITNFSIATSEEWKDKNTGERQSKTEWHRIVAFGKSAEILEKYLSKGSQIYIEGKLQTRSWDKDGQTHYTTEVVVQTFQFLSGGQNNQGQNRSNHGGYQGNNQQGGYNQQNHHNYQSGANNNQNQEPPDDDIPF